MERLLLLVDVTITEEALTALQGTLEGVAERLDTPVALALVDPAPMTAARALVLGRGGSRYFEEIRPRFNLSGVPLHPPAFASGALTSRWDALIDQMRAHLQTADISVIPPAHDPERVARLEQFRRDLWHETALSIEEDESGWLALTCSSRKMATWLCATLCLDDIAADFDDERLLLPAQEVVDSQDGQIVSRLTRAVTYWRTVIDA